MVGDAVQPHDRLHYRLPSFQRKIDRARALIRTMLERCTTPYVALSGGKDSRVVLDLVTREWSHVGRIWADDELEHEETIAFLTKTLCDVTVIAGYARHAGWFDPWRTPPHFRDPLPGMIATGQRMEPWSIAAGYDGVFVGLRKDEARHRRIALSRFGALHWVAEGQWRCNPLANWTVEEVWAYIAGRNLPYNPVYDTLTKIGVPRPEQRVGPLPLASGWHLRAGWPDLYRRLITRYGNQWGG